MAFSKELSLLALTIFILSGCSYAMEEIGVFKTGGKLPIGLGVTQFADQPVTFDVVKATSLATCLNCHTTGSKSMNTADKALTLKNDILGSIQDGTMPPKSSGYKEISACEKQILETWFEDQAASRAPKGAVKDLPQCANVKPAEPKIPTDFSKLELSWENLTKEIIAPKCLSCHSEEAAKKTVLETYAGLRDQALITETADESLLYKVTVGKAKKFMPPKSKGIPALTEAESDYLKRWIDAGAPEFAVKQ